MPDSFNCLFGLFGCGCGRTVAMQVQAFPVHVLVHVM